MDLLADLTPAQRQAVTHVDGPLLVLAGAGSGKTRVVTRRVAHLLRRGIPGHQILGLTFTNKAAGEMRERVEAIAPGSGVWLGTFHGLCARLLRKYGDRVGLDRGFTIYDQADRLRLIKAVMEELGIDGMGVAPEKVEAAISRAKNDLRPAAALGDASDHVGAVLHRVYSAYQQRLLDLSAVDFDDLLLHVVALLKDHADLRARLDAQYRYKLVDEYQDTNLAQYAILRGLSTDHPNIQVTGDPDQSIYGWRGANLSNILEFEHDFPGSTVVRLEQNYRSTKNILRVADHLIQHNRKRKKKNLVTDNPDGSLVELTTYRSEVEEAQGVASAVRGLVEEGGHSYREIAVFVRVTALTRGFESAFRAARIPYQVIGGMAFYERAEVKDAMAYLQLLANPKDDVAFARAIGTPSRSVGKGSLDKLAEYARKRGLPLLLAAREAQAAGLPPRAVAGLRDFVFLMNDLGAGRDSTAEELVRRMLAQSGYRKHWEGQGEGADDRLANLDELVTAARLFDQEHPEATIIDFLQDVSLASAVDRWKDDTGAVTLMTLHAAKGLEFPVVFIVGLEQNILPHARSAESDAQLEEERRLFFVGITRARQELRLSHCRVREFRGQRNVAIASQFLRELPEEAMTFRDLSEPTASFVGPSRRDWSGSRRPGSGVPRLTTAAAIGRDDAAGAPPDDLSAFRPGALVQHPTYGLGRVVAIDGAGPNRKGRVDFTGTGQKTFILAKAPLTLFTK